MDIFGAVVGAIDLIEKIYAGITEYRDSNEAFKHISHSLKSVEVRLEVFREYLLRSEAGLSSNAISVLQTSLEHISDILNELEDIIPINLGAVSQRLVWVGWRKRRAEGLIARLKNWDEDVHRTVFALDILSRVRGIDSLYKRLFDTGERSITAAWALSRRIYTSDLTSIPSLPLPKTAVRLNSSYSFEDNHSLGTLADNTVYIEAHYIERRSDEAKQKYELRRIASVFHSSDLPSMHLISCVGFIDDYESDRCFLVYNLPDMKFSDNQAIPTLADALERQTRMSLEDRYRIAVEVATAVFEIHAAGWVHKSIRSDNILVQVSEAKKGTKEDAKVGTSYLIGFEAARPLVEGSEQRPEMDPVKRKYHHPERQGGIDSQVEKFDIRHDMYSTGVVLIEIGYRKTIREIFSASSAPSEPQPGEAELNHKRLLDYARRLSDKMGSKYAKVALLCLTKAMEYAKESEAIREEFYMNVLRPLRELLNGFTVSVSYSNVWLIY